MGLSAALLPPHLAPVGHHSPPVWFPWHRERTERGMSLLTRLQVHPSAHTRTHTYTLTYTLSGNKGLSHSQSTFPQSCNKFNSNVKSSKAKSQYIYFPLISCFKINSTSLKFWVHHIPAERQSFISPWCVFFSVFAFNLSVFFSDKLLLIMHPCVCVCVWGAGSCWQWMWANHNR